MDLRSSGWSYPRIAAEVGLPPTTIRGLFERKKMTKGIHRLEGELLRHLYVNQGLSMVQVARSIGAPKSNVEYWMKKHCVARRPLRKYPRHPFSHDLEEKAYLLGLRLGDLYVTRYGLGIQAGTTTTHPAMLNLFRRVFEGYGHVSFSPSYNRRTEEYQWVARVNLDPSFSFLLRKRKTVPSWIEADRHVFLNFLAGFVDAEGTVGVVFRIRQGHRYVEPHMSISNTNLALLRHIARLAEPYFPRLRLSQESGSATSRKGAIRKKDLWTVSFWRRGSLQELLSNLPMKHAEKIERSRMVVDFVRGCDWQEARQRFEESKRARNQDVSELAKLACGLMRR